jgi:peptidoglycan/xylan/chitin deacetylase (PgdA/CDA1 family)
MSQTRDALAAAGVRCGLFRPPGGSYGPSTLAIAGSLGMRVVLWSVDPADWTDGIAPKTIVQRVLSNLRPGSIVLLHDGGGDQTATVKALPAIIKGIRKRHLAFVALSS